MKFYYWSILIISILCASCSKGTLDFLIEEPASNVAPANFTFINKSTGFDKIWWEFGDGEIGNDSIANHTYYLSGKYDVILKGQKGKKIVDLSKEVLVSAPQKCLVQIETDYGNMLVELFDDTPMHRDNFLKLAEQGYYDGLLFHRVINGFMIQGGDPDSRDASVDQRLGTGGPGYTIDAEIMPNRAHVKGALAAARQGDAVNPKKKSSGSQFYIVHGKPVSADQITQNEYRYGISYPDEVKKQYAENGGTAFLDQQYTIFGQVLEGMNVIDAIAATKTNRGDRPQKDVKMSIKVIK